MMLYGTPEKRESLEISRQELGAALDQSRTHINVLIQGRLNKNRHGNTGSARHFSSVTTRSLTKKRHHNIVDTTSNEIAAPDFQANSFEASKRTVTKRRVALKSRKAPDRSSLERDS